MATVRSKTQTAAEKNRKLKDEIEKKSGKTTEQLYEEREKRVRETIRLKQPDRVPVVVGGGYFAAKYAGLPLSSAYYDPVNYREAVKKVILDFEPDLYLGGVAGANAGPALEVLDPHHTRWPGGTLPPDLSHQAVEQEYMKQEEYDLFLDDPTDFTLRYLLPRAFGGLTALSTLPSLNDRVTFFPALTPIFTKQEFQQIARNLLKAGAEVDKFNKAMGSFDEEMADLGFPPAGNAVQSTDGAPFDSVSDFYRGMRGAMTDMYRCPEKLLAACDKILNWRIKRALPADPKKRGNPKRVFIALHRGAETFMSRKQFEKFYWPGLKKAMVASIDLGYVPMPFCEGKYGDRLEYFLEMPKGKVVAHFDLTDMLRAKDVLRDHTCIMGNVPSPLLQIGSPQEVEEYCAKLIKYCGKGGGFILRSGSSIDEAKPANIKAMVDSVKKYNPA